LLSPGSISGEALHERRKPAPLTADTHTDQPLALTRMMGAFVDAALRGELSADDPSFAAGLHAQEAIEAAIRSARDTRWETVL